MLLQHQVVGKRGDCHVNLLKPYYKRVVETNLDQDRENVVHPDLAEVLV